MNASTAHVVEVSWSDHFHDWQEIRLDGHGRRGAESVYLSGPPTYIIACAEKIIEIARARQHGAPIEELRRG
jgi:hypothetical protein